MKRILSVILCLLLLIPAAAPAESEIDENAVYSVKLYLELYPFSRQELIDQLVFDGFTAEVAEAAVDSCGIDWNELAARAAKQMLRFYSDTSREDLLNILLTSGYTKEEAEYGVTAAMGDSAAASSAPRVLFTTVAPTAPAETAAPVPAATPVPEEPAETPVPMQLSVTIRTGDIPYENLQHIRNQLTEEIFFRGDWNQVEFMGGEWVVGKDIPAGFYSVRAKDGKYTSVDVISPDAYHSHSYYTIEEGGEIGKLDLKDGMILEFSHTLVFGKPKTLGF